MRTSRSTFCRGIALRKSQQANGSQRNNNPSKSQITEERVLQEKAEIQNLVVVRHWALVDLRRRYEAAEHENEERKTPHQMNWSPPGTNGYAHVQHDPRLQIEGPKNEEDMSKALVKYEETPLRQLEDSLSKAMHRPNKLLRAPGEDIVDHLLNAWTRLRDSPSRPQTKNQKHHARCDSDSEDNEINFTRSDYGGRHIDGPRYRKNVHFQPAHVESDTESDRPQRRRRGLKHYVLDSDSVSTDSDSEPPTPTSSRRSSESRQYENGDRTRRPYVTSSDRSPNSSRPSSRNGSPPPIPMPRPNPAGWTRPPGGPPGTPTSLRPPPPHNVPPLPVPQRRLSTGPYAPMSPQLSNYPIPVSPSTSPSNTRGIVYPIPQQGLPSPHPLNMYRPASTGSHVRGSVRGRDSKRVSGDRQSFRESAKRDVKRGIIGAGAVAGLMDILEGLGGI